MKFSYQFQFNSRHIACIYNIFSLELAFAYTVHEPKFFTNAAPTVYVQHHLPHSWPHWLVEPKPHLPPTTQQMTITFRRGEEGTAYWCVPKGKKINPHTTLDTHLLVACIQIQAGICTNPVYFKTNLSLALFNSLQDGTNWIIRITRSSRDIGISF